MKNQWEGLLAVRKHILIKEHGLKKKMIDLSLILERTEKAAGDHFRKPPDFFAAAKVVVSDGSII